LTFLKRCLFNGRKTRTRLPPANDRGNRNDLLLSDQTIIPLAAALARLLVQIEAGLADEKLEAGGCSWGWHRTHCRDYWGYWH